MRITRDTLLKIAQDAAARQARTAPDLLAAYLCGSLLEDEFLLGGTTDVDLVFIYTLSGSGGREIVRLTDDVHLDIQHQDQREYRDTRKLREHPWWGPTLNSCKVLYDPQHFMDFTQASVRGQFARPDHIFARARQQAEEARQIWMGFRFQEIDAGPGEVTHYLDALEHAANAVASLSGKPLTERRFLPGFLHRAEAIQKPGLYAGLLGLLGAPNLSPEDNLEDWLSLWQQAYQAGSPQIPAAKSGKPAAGMDTETAGLHPDRIFYYSTAFQSMLSSGPREQVLWPLLRTWTRAIRRCAVGSVEHIAWRQTFGKLGLAGLAFTGRIEALDAYLDLVDETLEGWARANGAWQD
jgi:hypothetical protein